VRVASSFGAIAPNVDRCVSFEQHTVIDKATEGVSYRPTTTSGMHKVQRR
jgi:hypothetical protein